MPLYEYYCDCGNEEDRLLAFDKSSKPQICKCGRVLKRKFSTPYVSTQGGILVTREGKSAHGRDMAIASLNNGGGFREGRFKQPAIDAAMAGLEKPPKTVW
jgi:putative FmdB family regulatory protein